MLRASAGRRRRLYWHQSDGYRDRRRLWIIARLSPKRRESATPPRYACSTCSRRRVATRSVPRQGPSRVTFNEVRARIEVIRAQEEVRYQRSRAERAGLQRVAQPAALDDLLAV